VKMFVKLGTKHTDPTTAVDETAEAYRQFADGMGKLKLAGLTVSAQQQRSQRVELQGNRVPPAGGGPAVAQTTVEYSTTRPVILTVTDPDPDRLTATVEKVQLEAAKLGAASDLVTNTYVYTGPGTERSVPFRTVVTRKGGWDDVLGPAAERAAKRARAKAESLAAGTGVKLGEVLSVQEVPGPQNVSMYANAYNSANQVFTEPEEEFQDGELVRKVRVRVVYAITR
jgi:uncharacterized protein YggE